MMNDFVFKPTLPPGAPGDAVAKIVHAAPVVQPLSQRLHPLMIQQFPSTRMPRDEFIGHLPTLRHLLRQQGMSDLMHRLSIRPLQPILEVPNHRPQIRGINPEVHLRTGPMPLPRTTTQRLQHRRDFIGKVTASLFHHRHHTKVPLAPRSQPIPTRRSTSRAKSESRPLLLDAQSPHHPQHPACNDIQSNDPHHTRKPISVRPSPLCPSAAISPPLYLNPTSTGHRKKPVQRFVSSPP